MSASPARPVFTIEEVAKHNKAGDLWIVVDGNVYDLSKFGQVHPGGLPPLIVSEVAGKDATELFYGLHRASVLQEKRYARLQVGVLATADSAKVGLKKRQSVASPFPYAEAMGSWRKHSPYYNESHHKMRAALRAFMDAEIRPYCKAWDDDGEYPTKDVDLALGQAGVFASFVAGPETAEIIRASGVALPGGIDPENWDVFHALVQAEELRYGADGCYGVTDGYWGGMAIGLPPILKFGSPEMKTRIGIPVIRGEKRICLAISEPYAGSDVQQIKTSAVLRPDGSWLVTGVKKWITGGMVADYFTVLVNTKEHGPCMMLVERQDGSTVTTKPIKTSYSKAACTAYVIMHEAVVPPKNVIGKLGMGFLQTMANFNTERWGMICAGNRHSRMVLEECLKWTMQRKVFGKTLIQQPVIRLKLAEMAAGVEVVHSMLEDLTYQMSKMSPDEINRTLAGPIALLKYKQSRTATMVSDNACQIFGGRAVTVTGMGHVIEKFQKSFKFQAILGGSEEIMADFAIRQAMRGTQDMPARL
jgi:alkylation response protein AidB-like acyl-CoA dehydrogenase/predicted heme/steroid binding protein